LKAIIVGGGKVGFYLAKSLPERGYSVAIIEQDREQSRYCANNLDAEVSCGNGTTVEALEACGADKVDCVIAVMGQDESNLVCCQIAKYKFGVKKTIAKVNNPKNADALKELGVDIVISATDNIIQTLEFEVDLSTRRLWSSPCRKTTRWRARSLWTSICLRGVLSLVLHAVQKQLSRPVRLRSKAATWRLW